MSVKSVKSTDFIDVFSLHFITFITLDSEQIRSRDPCSAKKTKTHRKTYRGLTLPKKTAGLTNRQREFARYYVEGRYSNAECARLAGYSPDAAKQHAYKLLDGKTYPLVTDLIKELREERERKYGVTLIGQLKRLDELSRGAEESGQFSAAINAEKI